jgi:fatty aldehyde-generating acyl-ACP reductase
MQVSKFSFFVHFRKSIKDDISLLWKPLGYFSERFYEKLFGIFGKKLLPWGQVVATNNYTKNLGSTVLIPMSATSMLNSKREVFTTNMEKYLDQLVANGVKIAGLGALTSPMTAGGLALAHRTDIALTNGNAFTAAIMYQAAKKILANAAAFAPKIAIVGATGSVGSCVAKLLARDGYQNMLLMAQTEQKLQRLSKQLAEYGVSTQISTNLNQLNHADLVIVLTASSETLIKAEHLKANTIIIDGTQPRNTAASLLQQRPDVTVIDGGLVQIDNIAFKGGGFGLPKGVYFACFSETLLLALEGYHKHFCLGNASVEQADYIMSLAKKYEKYGFKLAAFSAFGKNVKLKNNCLPVV